MFTILFPLFYRFGKVSGIERCSKQRSWLSAISSSCCNDRTATADRAWSFADRLWIWLSQLCSGWRSALMIVKPETLIA
jgi:hypothetical protein